MDSINFSHTDYNDIYDPGITDKYMLLTAH